MAKQKDNPINFLRNSKFNYSHLKYAVIFIFVAAAIVVGFVVHRKNPKLASNSITVPTAYASDLPGWWIKQYFNLSVCETQLCAADADPDHDGLTNSQEFYYHTNPMEAHTVGDAMNDGELVAHNFDPSKPGHVSFDQVTSPEDVLGDSIVFDKDIKQMVSSLNDISKVGLSLPNDSELKVTNKTDTTTYKNYVNQLNNTVNKYFPNQALNNIQTLLQSGTDAQLQSIKDKSAALANDLKNITVPQVFLSFHKYNIAMFELIPQIIPVPTDPNSTDSEAWFDNVQEFLAVQQKLNFEKQALDQKFPK